MSRTNPHVIETKAKDYIRKRIDEFYSNGDALFRDITERDYGIDALLELFENGMPTGMMALLQIKGSGKTIVPLKKESAVSCSISSSNARYALQDNLPVILLYINILNESSFYYLKIQDALDEQMANKLEKQKSITVRIPIENYVINDMEPLFDLVRNHYLLERYIE